MPNTTHRRIFIAGLIIVLSLAGCAPAASPPATSASSADRAADTAAVRLYNTYGRALEAGALVYMESMLAAGEAHGRGQITDTQLDTIRQAGRQAETALRLAKGALQLYISQVSTADVSGQSGSTAAVSASNNVSERFVAFNEAVTQLTRVLVEMGVTR